MFSRGIKVWQSQRQMVAVVGRPAVLANGRSHADEDACLVVAPVLFEKHPLVVSLANSANRPRDRDNDACARLEHERAVPLYEWRAGRRGEIRMRPHATPEHL